MSQDKNDIYEMVIKKEGITGKRQRALVKLLHNNKQISNQLAIVEMLDIYCSQSSISRDLEELNIKKNKDGFYFVDNLLAEMVNEHYLQNLLKTSHAVSYDNVSTYAINVDIGYERLVSTKLRESYEGYILGTICGDGVILLVFDGDTDRDYVFERLKELAPNEFREE